MITFVGAEYIIANVLIAYKKILNVDSVSLADLIKAGIYIEKSSEEADINAIFLSSRDDLKHAIYDFSDYFEFNPDKKSIRIKETKKIDDIEDRFIGYLPFPVSSFLVKVTKEFAKLMVDLIKKEV